MLAHSNIRSAAAASPRVQRAALVGLVRPVPSRAIVRPRQVTCQGLFGLGLPELAVIAGVAALIFGPSKLPELGRGLGQTVKSFQTAANEFNQELKASMSDDKKAEEPAKPEEPKKQ